MDVDGTNEAATGSHDKQKDLMKKRKRSDDDNVADVARKGGHGNKSGITIICTDETGRKIECGDVVMERMSSFNICDTDDEEGDEVKEGVDEKKLKTEENLDAIPKKGNKEWTQAHVSSDSEETFFDAHSDGMPSSSDDSFDGVVDIESIMKRYTDDR